MKMVQGSRVKGLCCLLFIAYLLLPIASYAIDIEKIVDHIEKKYSEINDIKGGFLQKSFLKDLQRTENYSGRFFIKKPSSIRWEYSRPRDEEVIINGERIWIYKKSEGQIIKGMFEKGEYSHLPIALLRSMGDLKKDFYIKAIKDDTIELTPKHQMDVIKKIQLVTDDDEFPVERFTIFDNYENMVTIEIKEVDINTDLNDSIFTFKIPPDVEVFDLNQ